MMTHSALARRLRGPAIFVFTLLAIEFLDEFVFGAREAAWPLIRTDLQLSYEQIGLLLSVPELIASLIEPALGILGDVWKRRVIIIGGGFAFTLALILSFASHQLIVLLFAFILFYPASGAFVSLSQSTLMDIDTTRHEQNMARWTFAGSVGVVAGSLALGLVVAIGSGWRELFLFDAVLALVLVIIVWRVSPAAFPVSTEDDEHRPSFKTGLIDAVRALRRRDVLRWLTLLEFSDLMLDGLHGYLALYFVDVVGVNEVQAGLAVAVWTGVGLIGDLLLIPLLERVRGLSYLRISAALELVLFPAFLLIPGLVPKLIVLALLGLFNAGWYAVLQGQLYTAMPGQSGTVMAVGNVAGLLGSVIPLAIGLAAEHLGLGVAVWFFLAGPLALLAGLPRAKPAESS
jgi:MFS transporter, FSR family, fosmidomycin resistance protein